MEGERCIIRPGVHVLDDCSAHANQNSVLNFVSGEGHDLSK